MRFLLNAIAVLRGTRPPENLPADRVASQLASAREAIRLGLIDQAHAALASSKWGAVRNAARLNLLGVVHELRRDWKGAKKYYGRAVRADRGCEAAQQNLRRFYELDTFGRCADTIALGDEGPALMRLPACGADIPRPRPRPAGTRPGDPVTINGSIWHVSASMPGPRGGTGEGTSSRAPS